MHAWFSAIVHRIRKPAAAIDWILRTQQWRIYIQKFPARTPPQQDQILSFLHMFSPKSACVGGWRPLQRGLAPPKREILDPPLLSDIKLELCDVISLGMD